MSGVPRYILTMGILFLLAGCGQQMSQSTEDKSAGQIRGVVDVTEEVLDGLSEVPEEYRVLTIPFMRSQSFPGSNIEIVETIGRDDAYTSHIGAYESEGNRIQGLLTVPTGAVPASGFPAVVFLHGYIPPNSYVTTEKYEAYVDTLARAGLVVFKIDYRGHGQSGGEPEGAYYASGYVTDALNARSSLARLSYVNDDRIGMWGHSMSGNVVLRSMAVEPSIPVGVIWAGAVFTYSDMREYGIQDSSYDPSQNPNRGRRSELFEAVGQVAEDNPFWIKVAPTSYLAEMQGIVSLHHAINDPVVTVEYSRNLARLLKEAGTMHEFYEYEGGGHNLTSPAFSLAMQRSISILRGD